MNASWTRIRTTSICTVPRVIIVKRLRNMSETLATHSGLIIVDNDMTFYSNQDCYGCRINVTQLY